MTARWKSAAGVGSRGASFLLVLGVAAAPLAGKLPGLPMPVSLTDVLCVAAAAGLLPSMIANAGPKWEYLKPQGPLIVYGLLSVLCSEDMGPGLKELFKLVLYICVLPLLAIAVCGSGREWRLFRHACFAAVLLGLTGCGMHLIGSGAAEGVFGPIRPLFCTMLLAACVGAYTFDSHRVRKNMTGVVALVASISLAFSVCLEVGGHSGVPQRYVEGYAGLSMLHDSAFFGVGSGNYQSRIGAYYQGLPKENTMAAGTQIGFVCVVATMGLAGLGAYVWWLFKILGEKSGQRDEALLYCLGVSVVCGLMTPIFVVTFLLPLGLLHGLALRRRDECTATVARAVGVGAGGTIAAA